MRRHGVDSHGNLQEMITLVQAYWDIASRRFIDNVCMQIEKGFVDKMLSELETQCTLYAVTCSSEQVAKIMQEDVEIVKQRTVIAERVRTLQSAADILDSATITNSSI